MGSWAGVRGWLEVSEELLPDVYRLVEETVGDAPRFGTTAREAERCNEGWRLPTEPNHLTCYAFYGMDVRVERVRFIRHQLSAIAELVETDEEFGDDYPRGVFHVFGAENITPVVWTIRDGRLVETEQDRDTAL